MKILHDCFITKCVLPRNAISAEWVERCPVCRQKWRIHQNADNSGTMERIGRRRYL